MCSHVSRHVLTCAHMCSHVLTWSGVFLRLCGYRKPLGVNVDIQFRVVVCRGVLDTSCVLLFVLYFFAFRTPSLFFLTVVHSPTLPTSDAPTFFFSTYPLFFIYFLDPDGVGGDCLQIATPPAHNQPCDQARSVEELCPVHQGRTW